MKKLYFLILLPLVWLSCSSPSNYEKAIVDCLETDKKGVKTDLQIKFLFIDVSYITVADSISILQDQFEIKKAKKIESAQKNIAHWQESIEKQKGKKNQLVAKAVISNFSEKLAQAEKDLKEAQAWTPDYLNRYDSRNSSEILAKKADCKFSFFNPKLQARQELTALFILSADGEKCNNMIKQ